MSAEIGKDSVKYSPTKLEVLAPVLRWMESLRPELQVKYSGLHLLIMTDYCARQILYRNEYCAYVINDFVSVSITRDETCEVCAALYITSDQFLAACERCWHPWSRVLRKNLRHFTGRPLDLGRYCWMEALWFLLKEIRYCMCTTSA